MKTLSLLILTLVLSGCTKGPHVSQSMILMPSQLKYFCEYSDSIWKRDRTVAICDTQDECNQICGRLQK